MDQIVSDNPPAAVAAIVDLIDKSGRASRAEIISQLNLPAEGYDVARLEIVAKGLAISKSIQADLTMADGHFSVLATAAR